MKLLTLLLVSVLLICCNDGSEINTECNLPPSIEDVPWLVTLKESITNCSCETSIIRGTYYSQAVIFIGITDPACLYVDTPTLFNCEGEAIRSFTTSAVDQNILTNHLSRDSVLYRCKN